VFDCKQNRTNSGEPYGTDSGFATLTAGIVTPFLHQFMENNMKNNYVAKNAHKYNTARVFVDRKSLNKSGYQKHKNSLPEESYRGRNVAQCDIAGVILERTYPREVQRVVTPSRELGRFDSYPLHQINASVV
jgi:hypothetical protein